MEPIFLFITRSFWFAATAAVVLVGAGDEALMAVALLVTLFTGIPQEVVFGALKTFAPLVMTMAVLWERRGSNRPYTLSPLPPK